MWGKVIDNGGMTIGSVGHIFRYNYIHDLRKHGQPNYTYRRPTLAEIAAGDPSVLVTSTSNGLGYPYYSEAGNSGGSSGQVSTTAKHYGRWWIW